jgi:hypothetical protein
MLELKYQSEKEKVSNEFKEYLAGNNKGSTISQGNFHGTL